MSIVTNVLLSYSSIEENDWVGNINDWLSVCGHFGFAAIHHASVGGEKCWQGRAFVGSFNHFDVDEFATFLFQLEWDDPDAVHFYFQTEDHRPQLWTRSVRHGDLRPTGAEI